MTPGRDLDLLVLGDQRPLAQDAAARQPARRALVEVAQDRVRVEAVGGVVDRRRRGTPRGRRRGPCRARAWPACGSAAFASCLPRVGVRDRGVQPGAGEPEPAPRGQQSASCQSRHDLDCGMTKSEVQTGSIRRGCARGSSEARVRYGRQGSRDRLHLGGLRRRLSPYARWIALRTPRSPVGSTSGRCSVNIRNMCAVHSPMPLTAVSSRDHLVVGQLGEAVELELAVEHVLGERAQVATLAREKPARDAQLVGVLGEDLLRRRRAAVEAREQLAPDRARGEHRELLAGDRAHERAVELLGPAARRPARSGSGPPKSSISAARTGSARRSRVAGQTRPSATDSALGTPVLVE